MELILISRKFPALSGYCKLQLIRMFQNKISAIKSFTCLPCGRYLGMDSEAAQGAAGLPPLVFRNVSCHKARKKAGVDFPSYSKPNFEYTKISRLRITSWQKVKGNSHT